MDDDVRIVVTGSGWMGHGIGSVSSTLERMLADARNEVLVTAYAIGTGAQALLDGLDRCAERGIKVIVLVNRFTGQPMDVRRRLARLIRACPWCQLYDFSSPSMEEDLHAKLVVVDRVSALVGSANLSRHGLVTNHELGVYLTGAGAVDVARAIDLLLNEQRLVRRLSEVDFEPNVRTGDQS